MSITSFVGPDGRVGYRVRAYIGMDRNGNAITKCRTTYGTARQAQEIEQQMRATAERARNSRTEAEIYAKWRSVMINAKPMPLVKAFDKALTKPTNRCTSESRINVKRGYWNDFVAWMAEHAPLVNYMQHVTKVNAENYIAFLRKNGPYLKFQSTQTPVKLSNDTLNCYHETVRQVFNLLKNETGLPENPFDDILMLPAKHAERDAYTEEQLRTIFLKADNYMQPMFFIGLFTGLAEGDICTLRKDEINFAHEHIYRKRNKTRNSSGKISAIPMLPVLQDMLRRLVEDRNNTSEYVLPEQAADYLKGHYIVSRKIKNFLEIDCEFDTCRKVEGRTRTQSTLDFHSLRHTFCSIAGIVGIPLTVVQSIVGHMTKRMTELYSRHVEEQERLRWIRLFGERLKTLPNLPGAPAPQIETEDDRDRAIVIDAVKKADMETVRKILAILQATA